MSVCPICKSVPMSGSRHAPTLAELMADSLTHAVMAADRVDPAALETSLRALTRQRRLAGDPIGASRSARE